MHREILNRHAESENNNSIEIVGKRCKIKHRKTLWIDCSVIPRLKNAIQKNVVSKKNTYEKKVYSVI